jgi:sulfatase maturation enzyme AslB (radical SAM superfamily)
VFRSPSALGLVLTADCNLRCAYCYQDRKTPSSMAWPVVQAALDMLLAARGEHLRVTFTGGEPLMAFATVRRAVDYLHSRATPGQPLAVLVQTNGTLLDEERMEYLVARGIRLVLSFDGVPAAQDHRSAGSFPGLDRLLADLRERHPDYLRTSVTVNVTTHLAALGVLAESVRYLVEAGVQDVNIGAGMGESGGGDDLIDRLRQQVARIYEISTRHFELRGEVPVAIFRRTEPDPSRQLGHFCCGVTSGRSCVVDVDGQVVPCAMLVRSCQTVAPPPLGEDLARLSLGEIAQPGMEERVAALPGIARELRIFDRQDQKWSSYGKCRDCPSVGVCRICPVGSAKDPRVQHPLQVSDSLCAFNRVALEFRRQFPCQGAGDGAARNTRIPRLEP